MNATTTTGRSPKQERALLDKLGLVPGSRGLRDD